MSHLLRRADRTYGVLLGLLLIFGMVGCTPGAGPAWQNGTGQRDNQADTRGAGSGASGQTVELTVSSGLVGQVLAFAPVYINGEGPFHFAIDTGASKSVLDRQVADRLQLPSAGGVGGAIGIRPQDGATGSVAQVQVEQWRLGDVPLEPTSLVVLDLPDTGDQPQLGRLLGGQPSLEGLLGSDLLSGFGVVTLNYDDSLLIIGAQDA